MVNYAHLNDGQSHHCEGELHSTDQRTRFGLGRESKLDQPVSDYRGMRNCSSFTEDAHSACGQVH